MEIRHFESDAIRGPRPPLDLPPTARVPRKKRSRDESKKRTPKDQKPPPENDPTDPNDDSKPHVDVRVGGTHRIAEGTHTRCSGNELPAERSTLSNRNARASEWKPGFPIAAPERPKTHETRSRLRKH